MDSWTPEQLKSMELSGNGAMNGFLEKYGVGKTTGARTKYASRAAEAYRDKLKCAVQGIEWKKPKGLKSSGGSSGGSSSARGGSKEKDLVSGLFPAATSSQSKKDSANLGKNGFDLSTGQGSLLQRRYEESNDGWVPPPPPLPKGAKKGQFLHGLTPYQWVDALKQMSRQDDRTYHLKNMSEDERAQVVAAMSGQPIPARSSSSTSLSTATVASPSTKSDLKTLNPFGDSDSADDFFADVGKKKKDKKDKKDKKEKKEKSSANPEETDLERRMREAGEAAKALARERSMSARAQEEASTSVYAVPQKKKPSYSPQQFHGTSASASGSASGKYSGFGSQPWDPNAPSASRSDDWQEKMKVSLQSAKGWLSGGLKNLAAKLEGQSSSSSATPSYAQHSAHAPRSYQQVSRPPEATYDPTPPQQFARPPKPRGKPESFYSESSSSSSSESDSDADAADAPTKAQKTPSRSTSGVVELEHGFTNLMD